MRNSFLLCGCLHLYTFSVFATHNRAGRLTYAWLGGYSYNVTIETWTLIGPNIVADRCELVIYFGDGDSAVLPRINGPQVDCIPPNKDGVAVTFNIQYNVYTTTSPHIYPGPGDYTLSVTDPNRNSDLVNIPNAIMVPFTLAAFLKINPLLGGNNSPVGFIETLPLDTQLAFTPFQNNIAATFDAEGDSLVYILSSCSPPGSWLPFGTSIDQAGMFYWTSPQPGPNPPFSTFPQAFDFYVTYQEYRLYNSAYYLIGTCSMDFLVFVNGSLGIDPSPESNNKIFPNPLSSNGSFHITGLKENASYTLRIMNPMGQLIMHYNGIYIGSGFDLQPQLSSGIYSIMILDESEAQVIVQSIVIQ